MSATTLRAMSPALPPLKSIPQSWIGPDQQRCEAMLQKHAQQLRRHYAHWCSLMSPFIDDTQRTQNRKCIEIIGRFAAEHDWWRRYELMSSSPASLSLPTTYDCAGIFDVLNLCVWATPTPGAGSDFASNELHRKTRALVSSVEHCTTQMALLIGCMVGSINTDSELLDCTSRLLYNQYVKRKQRQQQLYAVPTSKAH